MKRPLLIVWIGLVLGETCGNLFHEIGFVIPASLFLFLFVYSMIQSRSSHGRASQKRSRRWKPFFIPMVCMTMALFVGVISWNVELQKINTAIKLTNTFQGSECVVRGRVLEHKKGESGYSSITLKNITIKSGEKHSFCKLSGKGKFVGKTEDIQIAKELRERKESEKKELQELDGCMGYMDILPGDQVEFVVTLQQMEGPRNPAGFDEKKYSYANGIYYSGFFSSVKTISRPGYSLVSILDAWKNQIEEGYFKSAPQEEAAFLCAMVLGDKTYLSVEQKKLYEENGVAHMLAISGLHVSMVGGKLYRALRKRGCGYPTSCLFGGCVLLFYGAMTGFRTSAVRAIIMYLMFLTAEYTGMPYDMISAMSFSGILMILEHPYRIMEGGFLISYASILAIGGVLPFALQIFWDGEDLSKKKGKSLLKVKQALVSSAVICIVTLPLILRFYDECSPYSILLNPCLLPFMGTIMTSGITTGISISFSEYFGRMATVFHMVFPWLQKLLCYPAVLILKGYDGILTLFRTFPCSLWVTGCLPVWKIILLYLIEGSLFWLLYKKREYFRGKTRIRRSIIFVAIIMCVLLIGGRSRKLRITMLDVGQGECILFQLPSGHTMMIDGGSTSKNDVFEKVIEPALRYYGISRLDYVVATHMDGDHVSGIEEMLRMKYPVKNLLISDASAREDSETYQRIVSYAEKNRTKIQTMSRGTRLKIGKVDFHCLHPEDPAAHPRICYPNDNAASMVLYMTYQDFRGLFTGDLEMEWEKDLFFSEEDLPLTLLKVAHHGSKYSTGKEFLQKIQPKYAILSAGKGNRYGHPHQEVLSRLREAGVEIHQTMEEGAVLIETDGDTTYVAPFFRKRGLENQMVLR